MTGAPLFCDIALARQLELAEGYGTVRAVEARASLFPESGATWTDVSGTLAMFDGVTSPLTQTFGLGLARPPTAADMQALEAFFQSRGAPVFHETSPLAGLETLSLLNERGYEAFEYTNALVRPIAVAGPPSDDGRIRVRLVGDQESAVWAETAARGWSEHPGLADYLRDIGPITARRAGAHRFLAELDGAAIGAGLLNIHENVAALAGASTIPEGRRQGAQLALLDARLRFAVDQGCTIAMMCAVPGSGSQRNAQRHGFQVAYTRLKWRLRSQRA